MMRKHTLQKLSLVLCLALVLSSFYIPALADDTDDTETEIVGPWADLVPEGSEIGTAPVHNEQNAEWEAKFEIRTFASIDDHVGDLSYYFYAPEGAETSEQAYPLIFVCHGGNASFMAAESIDGLIWASEERQEILGGAYLVYPIANESAVGTWGTADEETGELVYLNTLKALLAEIIANENVDTERIAVSGVFIGGYMAWSLFMDDPDTFACIYLTSAAWDYIQPTAEDFATVDALDKPIWIIHAEHDERTSYEPYVAPNEYYFKTINNIRFTRLEWVRFGDGKIVSKVIARTGEQLGQHASQYSVGQNMIYSDGMPYDENYPDVFVAWLLKAFDGTVEYEHKLAYTDLNGHWAAADIETLLQEKVIYADIYNDIFDPDASIDAETAAMWMRRVADSEIAVEEPLTRQAFAAAVYAMLGVDGSEQITVEPFADIELVAEENANAVNYLKQIGILRGCGDNIFSPDRVVMRAEAAAILSRCLELM